MAEIIVESTDDEVVLKALKELADKDTFEGWPSGEVPSAFTSLLEQFARFATGEEYLWQRPTELYRRASISWATNQNRKIGEAIIDLHSQEIDPSSIESKTLATTSKLVLQICTDDKPFLVDSISAALTDAGKSIRFFLNAVIDTPRSANGQYQADGKVIRESFIHAELDAAINEEEIATLKTELNIVLNDINQAVSDWGTMRSRMVETIERLKDVSLTNYSDQERNEHLAFLNWLIDEHFIFLGVRRYAVSQDKNGILFERDPTSDLGILKDSNRRILKNTYSQKGDLSPAVEEFLKSKEPILLAKANSKSTVHRRTYLDYVGIKLYDENGNVVGEDRFIGLYTADAYNRPASDIPLLRAKVAAVLKASPFVTRSHNEKALLNILETYPRDELFQVDTKTLLDSSIDILRLYKRPRIKLIMRRDRFDRFISAFVFIPRDQFNSDIREKFGSLLASTFNGRVSAFYPFFGDASLVRVHFIIGIDQGAPEGPGAQALTIMMRDIAKNWNDDFLNTIRDNNQTPIPNNILGNYKNAFEESYKENTTPSEAIFDISNLENLGDKRIIVQAYEKSGDEKNIFRLKIYNQDKPLRLSVLMPTLENFGLSVIKNDDYKIKPEHATDDKTYWINDFEAEHAYQSDVNFSTVKIKFEDALTAILNGDCDDDSFNKLVLSAGIDWRETWLLRTAAKYHQQTNFSYSQDYVADTLQKYPSITKALILAFHAKFSPDKKQTATKLEAFNAIVKDIQADLNEVSSLDEDRILKRFLNLFIATLRTNFYQAGTDKPFKPCIALKIDSQQMEEIPDPKPYREIFLSGPAIDGVHLRFAPIARGGLRWSDRREDFRTEVLGLVKAQKVKNAVIVPSGSKGGFYPKQLPISDDRNVIYEAGRDAYKLFIRGLLDITDNIVDGEIVTPNNVIPHDDPDPYLVVAADKGTAQFSDTANAISQEYSFWLGDAFASGGSAGYDHKVMGITARGAWEAVKRHFREMGKDIQNEAFTVAGVGDMSGDVFGNGMLLSKKIQLVAAFDHRDIFIDPTPDTETSFKERQRLFKMDRSSWKDYNADLISKGGGVFSRTAKSIPLSKQMQACLDCQETSLTPNELIKAILRAPMELFWLGGIGTYFKASDEENWRVGDRANDNIRIDTDEMRIKVVGEGANLGLTQEARIAFANQGGRINTDAIDNSAGVDSSDHEVNIKILLREAIEQGQLKSDDRNALLAQMTDDVALYVLRHNYDQTRALSQIEARAKDDIDAQSRFVCFLEEQGLMDRAIENLPEIQEFQNLVAQKSRLSRPELSILLAYSKLWLFDELIKSAVPDDPFYTNELVGYFPTDLHQFNEAIQNHRLRREIITTRIANDIIDTCGITFVHEAMLVTGATINEVTQCYEAARHIFALNGFAQNVDKMDNKISAQTQTELYQEAAQLLKEQVYRLVTDLNALNLLNTKGVKGLIDYYKPQIDTIKATYKEVAPLAAAKATQQRANDWIKKSTPENLAKEVSLFPSLERAIEVIDITREADCSIEIAGNMFFGMGQLLKIDVVRDFIRKNPASDNFDKRATRRLMEEITRQQKLLTLDFIKTTKAQTDNKKQADNFVNAASLEWKKQNHQALTRYERFITEADITGSDLSVSKLSLLSRQLTELHERIGSN